MFLLMRNRKMKKVLYQSLYRVLLFLSNHLNSKLIIKYKVLLGTSLLVFFNSCSKKDKPQIMCYDPSPVIIEDTTIVEDTTIMQTAKPDEHSKIVVDDTVKVQDVKPDKPKRDLIVEEIIEMSCYDVVSCYIFVVPDELVSDENHIYNMVDESPKFLGEYRTLHEYIEKTIQYPEKDKKNNIQVTTQVTFVVNKDGSVSDVKILHSAAPLLDEEVLRVINSMPLWEPGKLSDRVVRVRQDVSVMLRLPYKYPE